MKCALLHAAVPAFALACGVQPTDHLAPEGVETTFDYLRGKYDQDDDGVIVPAEYTRTGEGFARLDADADGRLTADDFPGDRWTRELGIRGMSAAQRDRVGARYAARAVVLAYFRPHPKGGDPVLSREDLERGFARLDGDASGALDAAEFARATDVVRWAGPGDAWQMLLAGIDAAFAANAGSEGDAAAEEEPAPDGVLSLAELRRYHESMAGKDGLLRGPPGVDPLSIGFGIAADGPPVGSPAPDFELAPPEGGARVRLSHWRGKRPVALIFGSYT